MIKQFSVKNYKALRDVKLDLTPIHVLIGPNDSGKTSILDALAALCRSTDHALQYAFQGSWSSAQLVWGNDPQLDVGFAVDTGAFRYELACRFSVDRNVRTTAETFREGERLPVALRSGTPESFVCASSAGAALPHSIPSVSTCVFKELSGVHLYRWVPRLLALPVAPDAKRRFRMDSTGFGLALCLDDILGYDRNLFGKLESRLRDIFNDIEAIRLLPEPAFKSPPDDPEDIPQLTKTDGKGLYFRFSGSEHDIPASQISDGVLLVLAYLAILSLPKPPRLLLIEEPENGIHPQRLEEVVRILRDIVKAQSHTQVILTTHSPYVVNLFKPEEVTVCRKTEDGSVSVRRLDQSKLVKDQMDLFTLGEIWTSEGDDALAEPIDSDQEQETTR